MKSKHEKRNCKQNKISEIHSILMKCPEVLKKFIMYYVLYTLGEKMYLES